MYDNNCNKIAGGTEVSAGQGRVCISNAVPGAQYILSVKYDSKSVQGSTFTGTAPICQYNFESRINGTAVGNSQGSINLVPNCSATTTAKQSPATLTENATVQFDLFPNPAQEYVYLSFVPLHAGNSNIALFTINGQLVSYLYNGSVEANRMYQKKIYIRNLAAGIYIIKFRNGEFIETKKFIIAK